MASPSNYSYDELVNTYLTKGADVEINSNAAGAGFQDSWYVGTIIRPVKRTRRNFTIQPKSSNIPSKLVVEYKTLTKDDAGTKALKVEIDAFHVRPIPPCENFAVKFKINDKVDAYLNDGLWEGSITDILGNQRYTVYFRSTRKEMDFDAHQLSVHREWKRGGEWVPPLRLQENELDKAYSIEDVLIRPGKRVEVSSNEDGLQGARFTAEIIDRLANGKYLIEYEEIRNGEDTKPLREEAESKHIRPCPPPLTNPICFKVSDQVDAFANDGWWVGEICKINRHKKYTVYFKLTNHKCSYDHSELRIHQDWIDGDWVIPSQASTSCLGLGE